MPFFCLLLLVEFLNYQSINVLVYICCVVYSHVKVCCSTQFCGEVLQESFVEVCCSIFFLDLCLTFYGIQSFKDECNGKICLPVKFKIDLLKTYSASFKAGIHCYYQFSYCQDNQVKMSCDSAYWLDNQAKLSCNQAK